MSLIYFLMLGHKFEWKFNITSVAAGQWWSNISEYVDIYIVLWVMFLVT